MLNKSDLSKIKTVVKGEIKGALRPVNKRLDGVDKRLDGVDKRLDGVDKRLANLERGVKKNGDDIKLVIDFFDRGYLDLKARVERIEDFIKIPPLTA